MLAVSYSCNNYNESQFQIYSVQSDYVIFSSCITQLKLERQKVIWIYFVTENNDPLLPFFFSVLLLIDKSILS